VQLWVNLPAKDKMSAPKYQAITKDQMGKYQLPDNNGTVEVVAGSFKDAKGPASTFTPIEMYNMHLQQNGKITCDLPENFNTGILVIQGQAKVNNKDIAPADHFVLFKNEGETISIQADKESILLVLSGEPINEPIAAYGPFLMNRHEELEQALVDFKNGKFGYLKS
jgi:redox-sensitive bicupin YhaK (pirin superfamily)